MQMLQPVSSQQPKRAETLSHIHMLTFGYVCKIYIVKL